MLGLLTRGALLARSQIRFKPFSLAPGIALAPEFDFARAYDEAGLAAAIERLRARGCEAIAVSQAFSVDRPECEERVVTAAKARSLYATSGHEVSSMYGLRARTRTAALNAAILPKMVRTARMTGAAVQEAAIGVPLMVMRSDGGVMDVREMERRPILTLLSGPAAGVAGALLHENVTDGVFIEVGGTSADCSAIRAGMPQMRSAVIGGHRTMLRTLDVRTLGIGGGSMLRAGSRRIVEVGPRSAHIAGLKYACFMTPEIVAGARVIRIAPTEQDPGDYVALVSPDGTRIALTPTCAANALELIAQGDFAGGSALAARRGFELLAREIGGSADDLAHAVLEIAAEKLLRTARELIVQYDLDPAATALVGGGGAAAAIVPYAAKRAGLPFRLARDAEVISPIGVALALIREVVERTVVDPSADEIVRIRREAQDAVLAAGASSESIEVSIEIESRRSVVRASACGASELARDGGGRQLSADERQRAALGLFGAGTESIELVASTQALDVYERRHRVRSSMRRTKAVRDLRVLDRRGVGRLALRDAVVRRCSANDLGDALEDVLRSATAFGDVGRAIPELYVLHGARIADLRGLGDAQQALSLAREELSGLAEDAPVVILAVPRQA